MQGFILGKNWRYFLFSYYSKRIFKKIQKLPRHWSITIYTNQNAELKPEASYSVAMKTEVLLYLYIPPIIKLQILSRSRNATKQRRYLWKISLLFLSIEAEEGRNFYCSWRSSADRDMEQSLVWTKQQNWASLSLFHSLVWKAEAVNVTSTHSSQQANASSEKSSGIFEETGGLNISEGPPTFKLGDQMAHDFC